MFSKLPIEGSGDLMDKVSASQPRDCGLIPGSGLECDINNFIMLLQRTCFTIELK